MCSLVFYIGSPLNPVRYSMLILDVLLFALFGSSMIKPGGVRLALLVIDPTPIYL